MTMRWSYDAVVDAFYVRLSDLSSVRQQMSSDGFVIVDFAEDDSWVGVEVINASSAPAALHQSMPPRAWEALQLALRTRTSTGGAAIMTAPMATAGLSEVDLVAAGVGV